MTVPAIQQGDYVLPLSDDFTRILIDIASQKPTHQHPITGLTINFRDPTYSPEQGGYHPVEIRLIPVGDDWKLDYVTDFHYVGYPWPELEKDFDVSWSQHYTYLSICGDLPLNHAHEFWTVWECNFVAYHSMNVFETHIIWEN